MHLRREIAKPVSWNGAVDDHPKIVAFPPLLWLIGATVSALVHFFVFSIRILPEPFALILGIVCMLVGPFAGVARVIRHARGRDTCQSRQTGAADCAGWALPVHSQSDVSGALPGQAGIGFLLNDWITLLFVVPLALVLHFGVILPEEQYLEAKFGEQYLALKRKVRRWI